MSKIHLEIRVDNSLSSDQLKSFEAMINDFIWRTEKHLSAVFPPHFVKSIGTDFEEK